MLQHIHIGLLFGTGILERHNVIFKLFQPHIYICFTFSTINTIYYLLKIHSIKATKQKWKQFTLTNIDIVPYVIWKVVFFLCLWLVVNIILLVKMGSYNHNHIIPEEEITPHFTDFYSVSNDYYDLEPLFMRIKMIFPPYFLTVLLFGWFVLVIICIKYFVTQKWSKS